MMLLVTPFLVEAHAHSVQKSSLKEGLNVTSAFYGSSCHCFLKKG